MGACPPGTMAPPHNTRPVWEAGLWRRGAVNVLPPNLRGHRDSRVVVRVRPTGSWVWFGHIFFSQETGLLLPLEKIFTLPRVGALLWCTCMYVHVCACVHMWGPVHCLGGRWVCAGKEAQSRTCSPWADAEPPRPQEGCGC